MVGVFIWLFVAVVFISIVFVLVMTLSNKPKEEYILAVDEIPEHWGVGGYIDIILEEGGVRFKILKIIDEQHLMVEKING